MIERENPYLSLYWAWPSRPTDVYSRIENSRFSLIQRKSFHQNFISTSTFIIQTLWKLFSYFYIYIGVVLREPAEQTIAF